jgi:hypothetical protein
MSKFNALLSGKWGLKVFKVKKMENIFKQMLIKMKLVKNDFIYH